MHDQRDHAIAAWIGTFGREPDASELRQILDLMPAYIRELTSAGFVRRHPEYARPPKLQRDQILDPVPE